MSGAVGLTEQVAREHAKMIKLQAPDWGWAGMGGGGGVCWRSMSDSLELPRLGSLGRGFTPLVHPSCSVVPKFVWGGHWGPSLVHIDGQHGLDCWELVAGKVSNQLLSATPGGQDFKTDPGPLLGAQGWYPEEEEHWSGW